MSTATEPAEVETAAAAEKICSRCFWPKPLDQFNRDRSRPDGRFTICRACRADHRILHPRRIRPRPRGRPVTRPAKQSYDPVPPPPPIVAPDPADVRLARAYEQSRGQPRTVSVIEQERRFHTRLAQLGVLRAGGWLYHWDAETEEVYRHRAGPLPPMPEADRRRKENHP